VKEVGELHPCFARKGGLCARAENEEADGRWGEADIFPGVAAAGSGRVEGVSEGWTC
jgi:hypothetical protein